jgi:hypothetical protein
MVTTTQAINKIEQYVPRDDIAAQLFSTKLHSTSVFIVVSPFSRSENRPGVNVNFRVASEVDCRPATFPPSYLLSNLTDLVVGSGADSNFWYKNRRHFWLGGLEFSLT